MTEKIVTKDGHQLSHVYSEARGEPIGNVILAHGITADMDEHDGLFRKAAEVFANQGFNVMRFDFRGHGQSPLGQARMTIAGEILDLTAVSDYFSQRNQLPHFPLGCSFGALSSIHLATERQGGAVKALVLWNPVLDVRSTFVDPGTEWSRGAINERTLRDLDSGAADHAVLEGFQLGRDLVQEMRTTNVSDDLRALTVPVLIYHGTADDIVPFKYTATAAQGKSAIELHPIEGAGHGFTEQQGSVIAETAAWLTKRATESKG